MSTDVTVAHPLDDPVAGSLTGEHAKFAQRNGRITRYQPDVAGFIAYPAAMTDRDWHDLADLVGPGAEFSLRNLGATPSSSFTVVRTLDVVQLTGQDLPTREDPDLTVLGPDDAAEAIELVERTKPGPFKRRTIEMGTYLGLRIEGRLVAMAGERLHPPGWTEISAVCVDPEFRRLGIGARMVAAVGASIRSRGKTPFLHALSTNTPAIELYERLGFRLRARPTVTLLQHTG